MKNKLYILFTIVLFIVSILLLVEGLKITKPETHTQNITTTETSIPKKQKQTIDYQNIKNLFVSSRPSFISKPLIETQKPIPVSEQPVPLPVLRYIGNIVNSSGIKLYIFRDTSNGRLVTIGKGVPYEEIEFLEEKNDKIILKINNREIYVKK